VLVFSQMVRVLDIISDYMRLRGFQHQRLDGSTPAGARHQARTRRPCRPAPPRAAAVAVLHIIMSPLAGARQC